MVAQRDCPRCFRLAANPAVAQHFIDIMLGPAVRTTATGYPANPEARGPQKLFGRAAPLLDSEARSSSYKWRSLHRQAAECDLRQQQMERRADSTKKIEFGVGESTFHCKLR